MAKIKILDKEYDEEYVIEKGKARIKKLNKSLFIPGIILLAAGAIMLIFTLLRDKELLSPITLTLYISAIIAGAILLVIVFIKKDPIKSGIKAIKKEDVDYNQKQSVVNQTIKPDKTIIIENIDTQIQVQNSSMTFRFVKGKVCSKVFGSNDIKNFELMVDDVEVYNSLKHYEESSTSTSTSKDGRNKFVKFLSVAAPRVGGIVNAVSSGKNKTVSETSTSSDKQITKTHRIAHEYTFVLRLNDVSYPTFVAKNITIEEAENLANLFDIIVSKKNKPEEKQATPEARETKEDEEKLDKFAEIKEYKKLLDSGIITQEEFDAKKKELL